MILNENKLVEWFQQSQRYESPLPNISPFILFILFISFILVDNYCDFDELFSNRLVANDGEDTPSREREKLNLSARIGSR